MKILKHWDLDNLASILNIKQSDLKKIIFESYDPALSRMQFSFVSFEILMRIFVRHQTYQSIEEEFKRIIYDGASV